LVISNWALVDWWIGYWLLEIGSHATQYSNLIS